MNWPSCQPRVLASSPPPPTSALPSPEPYLSFTSTGDLIHDLILELNRELGTGFILVTHDQGLASLASRILTMRDGRFEDE